MGNVIPFPLRRPDLDVCDCGDYRRDHDELGCILCRAFGNGTCGYEPLCKSFRFSRVSSDSEIKLRQKLEATYEFHR